jgi:hypothetical protein
MLTNNIEFIIQTLEGNTFPVSIPQTEAERIVCATAVSFNPYNKYGLDVLKDAICKQTGIDPVTQQLVGHDELTVYTPLLDLANKVITLIIKPSISCSLAWTSRHYFQLIRDLKYLKDFSDPTLAPYTYQHVICYLYSETQMPPIEAIGQKENYIKLAIKNIPPELIFTFNGWSYKPMKSNYETPKNLWLQCNDKIEII